MTTVKNTDDDNFNSMEFPKVFVCDCCSLKHTALAFSDPQLEYLNNVLVLHMETIKRMLVDVEKKDKAKRDSLEIELVHSEELLNAVNGRYDDEIS
jgi:hypothetical protein